MTQYDWHVNYCTFYLLVLRAEVQVKTMLHKPPGLTVHGRLDIF